MNFFIFDQERWQIAISDNFWVFIATWIPLTLVTGAVYMIIVWRDARRKGRQFNWPWTNAKRAIQLKFDHFKVG